MGAKAIKLGSWFCWIVTYLLNKVICSLNNQGLVFSCMQLIQGLNQSQFYGFRSVNIIFPSILVHEDDCFICGDGGELLMCDKGGCAKCYHKGCLGSEVNPRGKWICPWHFCDDCGKWANILCSECPNSYCRAHSTGQITELGNGIHVCCDHIVTRKKTSQNQTADEEKSGEEGASTSSE